MEKDSVRNLYQCSHARVKESDIYCAMGHALSTKAGTAKYGMLNIKRLMRGEPLRYRVCQFCTDYDEMDPPVPESERGWICHM